MSRVIQESADFEKTGEVSIRLFKTENGKRVYVDEPAFEKNNLIVSIGRAVLIDLMLGQSKMKLSFIRWGRGGAPKYPEGDPLEEFEVKDEDSDVSEFLIEKTLEKPERLSPTAVRFVETLISDEVDSNVNEAAVFFKDDATGETAIFARITFPTIALLISKGFGVELSWTYNFNKTKHIRQAGAPDDTNY